MPAANPNRNRAAGPDSPAARAAVLTVGQDYSANPPNFIEISTSGSYTLVCYDGTSVTFSFVPGTKWLRVTAVTAGAGPVLGYWI